MFGKKNKYLVITIVGLVILALLGLLSRFFIRKDADDIKNKYELTSCNVLHHSTIYENFYNQSIVIYNNKIYTFLKC